MEEVSNIYIVHKIKRGQISGNLFYPLKTRSQPFSIIRLTRIKTGEKEIKNKNKKKKKWTETEKGKVKFGKARIGKRWKKGKRQKEREKKKKKISQRFGNRLFWFNF